VHPGDIVVADEEGVVVTPASRAGEVLGDAQQRQAREDTESLDEWEASHRAQVERILSGAGFEG
jgi:4-hydroxy-4-methyl-2-oxoglutarate aldolase